MTNKKGGTPIDTKHIVVFIAVDSQQTAKKITDMLLTERKAAYVNIVPAVESYYWWQRKKTAQEHLLIVKTQAGSLDELVALVKKHHPYTIPEIITLPIIGGNQDYLRWVEGETG